MYRVVDGSDWARLPIACGIGVASLRTVLADIKEVSCGKLRIVLPDGTQVGEESSIVSFTAIYR